MTGMICLANVVQRHDDGSCDIALDLPAFGSAIVVFRRDGVAPERTAEPHATEAAERTFVEGTWTVKFQPGRRAPESVRWDRLIDWTTSEVDGIRYFSGTATYSMQCEMPVHAQTDHWLDLGEVREVAEVNLDGKPLGTAWTYPFRVKVPAGLLRRGMHDLEVKVTNVWNNRLVGDKFLDASERITRTNMQHVHNKNTPLVPAGLLGPVTLGPPR